MRRRALGFALIAIAACVAFPTHADSLDQIAAFAEKICNQSLSGSETSTTITANLNGDVKGLAKVLIAEREHLAEERQHSETDRPDQADALAQITDSMAKEDATLGGNMLYSISQLKYVNGYQEDVSHYIVFVTYQRVFKLGLQDISNATRDKTSSSGNLAALIVTGVFAFKYGEFAAGDWIDEALSFRFLRTENGWLLQQSVGDPDILASHIKPKPPAAPDTPHVDAPTPAPTASTPPSVDPERASLSQNPTQTVYTVNDVNVYVHGYQGEILCTLARGTPVPGRIQSRPPQFAGNYGVVSYRADLCPREGATRPRDMYDEFFFRATLQPDR